MDTIMPTMLISEVLRIRPEAAEVFSRHGLGCASCLASGMDTVAVVATMHEVSVEDLLADLNAPSTGSTEEE